MIKPKSVLIFQSEKGKTIQLTQPIGRVPVCIIDKSDDKPISQLVSGA